MAYPNIRIILKAGRAKPLWLGHPWILSKAIHRVECVNDDSGLCTVTDNLNTTVGFGYYNPRSRIKVRMMQHRRSTHDSLDWIHPLPLIHSRLVSALSLRAKFGLPNQYTTGYRLVNAEGDLLPGLVIDVFNNVVVIQFNSQLMYDLRADIGKIVAEVGNFSSVTGMLTDSAVHIEGMDNMSVQQEILYSTTSVPKRIKIQENGVQYSLNLNNPQKTGFFFDQRENRQRFGKLCNESTVLDLFSFVGGFGLNAAKYGAKHVTIIDSSQPAVNAARTNANLNGYIVDIERQDVVHYLKNARLEGRNWQRIICDPPKFVHNNRSLGAGLKRYTHINALAMDALAPGGLMMSCSCSHLVTQDNFIRMLTHAGQQLRRNVVIHGIWGQGTDHPYPTVAPECNYLKAALLSLD